MDWEESRDKWLTWGNTIQRFIQRCIEIDENAKISTSELHELHTEFARNHDLDTVTQYKLTQEVKKLSYANYSRNMRFESGDRGGIRGIRVVLPSEEKKQETNSILEFIRECVEKNEGNKISGENLYKLYSQFAGGRDMKVQKRKNLTEKIKELSYVEYSNTYRFEGEQKRGFKNIAVNVSEVGDGSQNKGTPRPSPKTTEPSPEQPSKEQKNRGGETKERENSENGDGPGEHVEEKTLHPVSRESEKKKKEGELRGKESGGEGGRCLDAGSSP
ncbi:hypothetical protein AKJ61_03920 [candidate division MSBL1 archaeon SCGC-AAA259B11]|uniref:Uncharacterized protein n=1 Tax=candidate division MSBL1 archaeon SCGC-AAA259B11 TaxID=1698260 RepID=A0A133U422_9EURY|nr:hypothetical protein AKJ61_03920 [candidate division MSBL1 archaeon SCGC-AAA259B11]